MGNSQLSLCPHNFPALPFPALLSPALSRECHSELLTQASSSPAPPTAQCPMVAMLTNMMAGEMKRQQIWKKSGGGKPSIISMSLK